MPQPLTPRSLRGDALFDLEAQYDELAALVADVERFDEAWTHTRAHILRRVANVNRLRHSSATALRQAQESEAAAQEAAATLVVAA